MQIGDWGNVLIHHVRERMHRKYSPWACLFSGVKLRGAFHFQKIIFLQLLQIWSSYCFHCDTDQLWMHTQSNNKTKCFKQILLTVKNPTPHLRIFWHIIYIRKPRNKENVEVNINKNTDENEIYKNKIKRHRHRDRKRQKNRERIDKSIKTQVNRHIHTKHTGKQLLYSH